MSSTQNTPRAASPAPAEPQISLLATGYSPVILDGQILAVALHPGASDDAFVPAIIDGQVAAVPVHNPLTTAQAAEQAQPAPAAPAVPAGQPVADPGLPLAVRHCILYGSVAALAAGGAVWMLGAAVGEVAPHADQLGHVLKWAAIAVAAVVVGLACLLGKLRSVAAGAGAGATASGDGSSATGTVLALVHRTHQTNIGKQSAGWRGSITNNNG
ncbi:hypothetical protein [Kitasatospora sp. DSM 101779]|uniref:hypothetical protein n=1 Tax=Kitasatospora sp. DSM 101779 TaxID=2853165 RepID=UPI0021D9580F|nr:hypothetical protein [Kitasatospora sp. DSM 101779]MCU7827318.1 hypothetical protein [Kitasatospora sp. DSM 101779]